MRNAFAAAITELAAADPRVVLLAGDIGNRLFDNLKGKFPDRFYNCGVAEANMVSLSAGMALTGLRPFAYTITPFITTRVFEQLRVDVCYHNAPVTIVGTGAGLSYASLGPTHHSLEDIAILRTLPNLTVLCPADATEVKLTVKAVLGLKGPAYIRLGKKGEPNVHATPPTFVIGKGIVLQEGKDVCLLGVGNMADTGKQVAGKLAEAGFSARVVSLHTVKPLDAELLRNSFASFRAVVVIEEHGLAGGAGSAVAEWLSAQSIRGSAQLLCLGTSDAFIKEAGTQEYAREKNGLGVAQITQRVLKHLREQRG
jgi:transketolase